MNQDLDDRFKKVITDIFGISPYAYHLSNDLELLHYDYMCEHINLLNNIIGHLTQDTKYYERTKPINPYYYIDSVVYGYDRYKNRLKKFADAYEEEMIEKRKSKL